MKNQKDIIIPAQALKLGGFLPGDPLSIHIGENTLVTVPESMTALEAVNTIAMLNGVISELLNAFMGACGSCEERLEDGECPYGDPGELGVCPCAEKIEPDVIVSDSARKQMGIPPDVKVELLPDEGEGLVVAADYRHDITDVPESVRTLLAIAGVCPGRLDELIMDEAEVWHG